MEWTRRLAYIPIQVQPAQHGAERSTSCGSSRDTYNRHGKIVVAALSILAICSIGRADPLGSQAQTEVARFAAVTMTDDQGARAIVSNVTASAVDSDVACPVGVTFVDSDGSLTDREEQSLKPGASASIAAKGARNLVRARITIKTEIDAAQQCDLLTRLEIYDLHTGTTFISIAPNPVNSPADLTTSSISRHKALKRNNSIRQPPALLAHPRATGVERLHLPPAPVERPQ
jgi:hypothetical protein